MGRELVIGCRFSSARTFSADLAIRSITRPGHDQMRVFLGSAGSLLLNHTPILEVGTTVTLVKGEYREAY